MTPALSSLQATGPADTKGSNSLPLIAAGPEASGYDQQIEIFLPVFNEEKILESSVRRLDGYLRGQFPIAARITIVDNASTDRTEEVGNRLADEIDGVSYVRLDRKGRGLALREAWSVTHAQVACYMDIDLSTDLNALFPLVAPLLSGHSDVAIGTRLAPSSNVSRGPRREFISRSYNRILRSTLRARFTDAQCGFKAVRTESVQPLLNEVKDDGWFFDTELLMLAQRRGLRIHEVPVDWTDDPDSRVDIVSTAWIDLKGVARLLGSGQISRFVIVGVFSTIAYALIYLLLRQGIEAGAANAIALALTAVGNTAANRHWTFGLKGRERLVRQYLGGAVVYLITLALTSGALVILNEVSPSHSHFVEVTVLVAASIAATVTRYFALKSVVFSIGLSGRIRPKQGATNE